MRRTTAFSMCLLAATAFSACDSGGDNRSADTTPNTAVVLNGFDELPETNDAFEQALAAGRSDLAIEVAASGEPLGIAIDGDQLDCLDSIDGDASAFEENGAATDPVTSCIGDVAATGFATWATAEVSLADADDTQFACLDAAIRTAIADGSVTEVGWLAAHLSDCDLAPADE